MDNAIHEYIREEVARQLSVQLVHLKQDLVAAARKEGAGSEYVVKHKAERSRDSSRAAASPKLLRREEYALVEQQTEAVDVEGHIPESMYAYCMAKLCVQPDVFTAFSLVGLALIQQVLLWCFYDGFTVMRMEKGWKGPAASIGIDQCIFAHRSGVNISFLNGKVTESLLAAMISMASAAVLIMRDDQEALAVMYPVNSSRCWVRCLCGCVWFLQVIFMPLLVATITSGLMAVSNNGMEMVLNSLAIVFILEIDNFIYAHCLGDVARLNYRDIVNSTVGRRMSQRVEGDKLKHMPKLMFALNIILMFSHWMCDMWMDSELGGMEYLRAAGMMNVHPSAKVLLWLLPVAVGLRSLLQTYAWKSKDTRDRHVLVVGAKFFATAFAHIVLFFIYWFFMITYVSIPFASGSNFGVWQNCLSQSDK